MRSRFGSFTVYALTLVGGLALMPVAASAASLSENLQGEWSGSGEIARASGETELIRCRGSGRAVSENSIEQHFHCASTDKEFDFFTSIRVSEGRARGEWTAPDRSGTMSGEASPTGMQLHLSSASGEGELSVTIDACSQSLTVTGWSDELKSMSVSLEKEC